MPIHDHEPSFRGRAFLWGGVGLGLLFVAAMFTRGFGLLGGAGHGAEPPALMIRQGDKIFVPEGSALRNDLSVMPAVSKPVSGVMVLPAVVEADPARCSRRSAAGWLRSKSAWAIAFRRASFWR